MKSLCLLVIIVAVSAEPLLDNRYLPPLQDYQDYRGGGGITPSQNYGPPIGSGHQKQTDALFGSRKTSYDAAINYNPNNRPSSQYGPPQSQYNPTSHQNPSSQYGPPQSQYNPTSHQNPSSQYGPPQSQYNQNSQHTPSSQYGPPQSQPSLQYGAPSGFNPSSRPSSQYGAPGFNSGAPGASYGSHSSGSGFGIGGGQQHSQGRFGSTPSNAYGPPDQNRRYLPPGNGYDGDDGSNGEPANYKFEYMVKDDESGNDFGHGESRQGDRAEGWYYVVLPDGRKQTVEYVADQDGYKPRISYEDTGCAGAGGYDRNSQRGYNNNGPY